MVDASHYRLGVAVMDLQHAVLLGYINRLEQRSDDLGTLIAGFVAYAETHFREEEALMASSNYPASAAHMAAHQSYLAKFDAIITEVLGGSPARWEDLLAYLETWWTEHILGVDKSLAQYLIEHGLAPKPG